jgi:hypothetical protein
MTIHDDESSKICSADAGESASLLREIDAIRYITKSLGNRRC